MTRPIETIRAEIAELEDANAKAPGWGAAVGARLERLSGLYGEMAAAVRAEAQLHREPLPERWVNARIDAATGRLFYTSEADARANGAPGIIRPVRVSGPEPGPAEAEGWRLVPDGRPVELKDCLAGLFLFDGRLAVMSEYGRDAYLVSSGEYFWGGTSNPADRARLVVQPMLPLPPASAQTMWPEGFSVMEPRSWHYLCATWGCGERPRIRIDRGGIGSDYCEPCARRIAEVIAPAAPLSVTGHD